MYMVYHFILKAMIIEVKSISESLIGRFADWPFSLLDGGSWMSVLVVETIGKNSNRVNSISNS